MRRLFLFLFCCIATAIAFAQNQNISILSFELDPFATTAQADSPYAECDKGGELYAIIKVKDSEGYDIPTGFSFDFGAVKTLKVEKHEHDLWVWVQRNAKTVTVYHPDYRTIEKYDLGQTIQPGKTYNMRVTMDRTEVVVKREVRKQVLQFVVSPANEHAIVKVKLAGESDYILWGEVDTNGTLDRSLDYGSYDYVISAENYEESYGRVSLSNSRETFVERVTLRPNFGFLEVSGDNSSSGAEVYVNDRKVGQVPYKSGRMACGTDYRITVTNGDLYKPYNSTFAIRQGETTRLTPQLQSDFAQTTLRVDGNAEIYVDGKLKGNGSWTGPLKAGQYTITCRKENHRESSKLITVRPDFTETFDIPAPTPITGSLYVRSTPSGATITVDGRGCGKTPVSIPDVLIGNHYVTLSHSNYKNESCSVTVKEGEQASVDVTMSSLAMMVIDSYPSGANLSIDGRQVGTTPYSAAMSAGKYKVHLSASNYHDVDKTINFDINNPSIMLKMRQNTWKKWRNSASDYYYEKEGTFYIQPSFHGYNTFAVGGKVGTYFGPNLNAELGYMYGLNGQDVYWKTPEKCSYDSETLHSHVLNTRIGCGLCLGALRFTPQVGADVGFIKGDISKSTVTTAVAGCRMECSVFEGLYICVTPEYSIPVAKSDTYKRILDGGVQDFNSGFKITIGLNFDFLFMFDYWYVGYLKYH